LADLLLLHTCLAFPTTYMKLRCRGKARHRHREALSFLSCALEADEMHGCHGLYRAGVGKLLYKSQVAHRGHRTGNPLQPTAHPSIHRTVRNRLLKDLFEPDGASSLCSLQ